LFSETTPQGNGGTTMNPRARTPYAIELGYELAMVQFSRLPACRLALWLDATMSSGREIRSYDYVNRPYERVRDALRQDALTVFQSAT
jgi:hypothetical protein